MMKKSNFSFRVNIVAMALIFPSLLLIFYLYILYIYNGNFSIFKFSNLIFEKK